MLTAVFFNFIKQITILVNKPKKNQIVNYVLEFAMLWLFKHKIAKKVQAILCYRIGCIYLTSKCII